MRSRVLLVCRLLTAVSVAGIVPPRTQAAAAPGGRSPAGGVPPATVTAGQLRAGDAPADSCSTGSVPVRPTSARRDVGDTDPAGSAQPAPATQGASGRWHEFGHSVVNPLTEANRSRLSASLPVFRTIRKDMKRAAYDSWEITVNELLVRAAAMRISARILKGDEALQAIATQHTASPLATVYAYRASDLLETFYEPGRSRWKDYAAFYPVNLLLFDSLAEEISHGR